MSSVEFKSQLKLISDFQIRYGPIYTIWSIQYGPGFEITTEIVHDVVHDFLAGSTIFGALFEVE